VSSAEHIAEASILVDSYGSASALVKLAQLAAPACRIEPQLLRQLRLECVPEADVSVEQELWHSELVDSRGAAITFRSAVARVLRDRLREWRVREADVIERARGVMSALHANLSPLLVLEDELAWAEIFNDNAAITGGAQDLLNALLARRDGLDNWLGRAWVGLPQLLKESPQGRELAQVAAAKGAPVNAEKGKSAGAQVAHMLPLVTLPVKLHGLQLDVNVAPEHATHVLEVPRTQPRALAVTSAGTTQQVVFGVDELRQVHVSPGVVVMRTLVGDEYELEAEAASASALLEIEMLPAGRGMSLIIRYGDTSQIRRIIVDCGSRPTGKLLADRLAPREDAPGEPVELLVLTHGDDDRIGGALEVLKNQALASRIGEVWFNGLAQRATSSVAS
jgi:hypothetical protein